MYEGMDVYNKKNNNKDVYEDHNNMPRTDHHLLQD